MSVQKRICAMKPEELKRFHSGAFFLGDVLKVTVGPHGQNWALEKGETVTNDGYTIAVELKLDDELAQRGLTMARKAVIDSNTLVGDGSTTAGILVSEVLKSSLLQLPRNGALVGKMTPSQLLETLDRECKEVVEKLNEAKTLVTSKEELVKSVLVSSENETLAKLIGETQWELGPDGVIIAEEVNDKVCSIERVNGIRFDNGVSMPVMINNQEKGQLEASESRVILTNHVIDSLEPLKPVMDSILKSGSRKVVLVCRAIGAQAAKDIEANMAAGFSVFAVNAPYTDQNEVMEDLAAITGAKFISTENGELGSITLSDVGYTKRLVARRFDTVMAGADGTEAKTQKRSADLEKKLKGSESEFEKRNINQRLAQLKNGFALLKVGSVSVVDRKRLKDKADDAVNAARNILQEGTVPGAGKAFKEISDAMPDNAVLKQPLLALYQDIKALAPQGWEAEEWVRDSVKVLRVVLESCVSVAGNIATAAGVVVTKNETPRYVEEVKKD